MFSALKHCQKSKRVVSAKESVNVVNIGNFLASSVFKNLLVDSALLWDTRGVPGCHHLTDAQFYLSKKHKGSALSPTMNRYCCYSPVGVSLLMFRHLNFCVVERCLISLVFNALPAARGMDKAAAKSFRTLFCGFNTHGLLFRSESKEINLCIGRELESQSRAC